MKNKKGIICALLMCITAFGSTVNAQWNPQTSGVSQVLNHIYFYDVNTGYSTGSINGFLKTTNGGENWVNIDNGDISGNTKTMKFFDSQKGIAITQFGVYKTYNGGNNWINTYNGSCWSGEIIDTNNIYITYTNQAFRTTNGGQNWSIIHTDTANFQCVSFINSTTGYLSIEYGELRKTTNGGANWTPIIFPDPGNVIYHMKFANENRGWAISVTDSNRFFRTDDGGNTWNQVYSSTNYLYGFDHYGPNKVWLIGDGKIPVSINGGDTWDEFSISGFAAYSISFANENYGWLCGSAGKIYHSTNGGGIPTSLLQTSTQLPEAYKLEQNYPNPFNPSTTISFSIAGNTSSVKLSVYNSLGQMVSELVNKNLQPGAYSYRFDAARFPSGVYYYKLEAGEYSQTKKMLLVK
ncbi:MAG TPA: T9SS type A sorting domain-containing protein [Ignavibacteria bacterium]|nr:T9SS type A sorting domain-containing protein [Ignavibacteria bacterium]